MDLSLSELVLIGWFTAAAVAIMLWWYVYRSQRVLLDHQQQRSLHQGQAVTGGGIFMFVPLCLAALLLFPAAWPIYVILMLCLLGWADDKFDLSFQLRLLLQVVAAVVTLAYFDYTAYSLLASFLLLSLLWWVNLFNFMDGANGLAGLHALLGLAFYHWVLELSPAMTFVAVTAMLLLLVYLVFNLWLNKLFMGDSGSLPLAWLLAVLALYGVTTGQLSLLQVAMVHAVFITDATLTLFYRMFHKEAITQAHATHLYQRLIKAGGSHGQVAVAYAALTAICAGVAWLVSNMTGTVQLLALLSIYLILMLIFMKNLNTGR